MTRDWLILGCRGGHDWVPDGGRACPNVDQESRCPISQAICSRLAYPSQPVFKCSRCPAIDYGESGGPGWDHCTECMRAV